MVSQRTPLDASNDTSAASQSGAARKNGATSSRRLLSAEDLAAQLDRNSATGRSGELIALADERGRLRDECGCPDPERHVEHVALTDVGRGYDIESRWPGHGRFIEVKASAAEGDEIFLSDREREVLAALGPRAWIYRVRVTSQGDGRVVQRLQDPIAKIPTEAMKPVAWRVRLPNDDH